MREKDQSALVYLFRNRRPLIIAMILGAGMGGIITVFIPKKYVSTAIVYPYNSHTRDEIINNPQFGYEVETEQLLQLLESKTMRDRTIDHFKLFGYYEVDTAEIGWRDRLALLYINDVQALRSKYLSVVINVTMKDPELAAEVANFQVDEVNRYREEIFKENRDSELQATKLEFELSEKYIEQLKDSIYAISGNDRLLFNFIENLNNENYDPSNFVTKPEMEEVVDKYIFEFGKYKALRTKYSEMMKAMNTPLPSVYSIDKASPNYRKTSPSYVINSLIGGSLIFVLTLLISLFRDKWIELKETKA